MTLEITHLGPLYHCILQHVFTSGAPYSLQESLQFGLKTKAHILWHHTLETWDGVATCGDTLHPCATRTLGHEIKRHAMGWARSFEAAAGCSTLLWCITTWVGYVGSMLVALLMWWALGHGLTGCKLCVRYGQHVPWWAMVALSGLGHGQDDEQWVGYLCAR